MRILKNLNPVTIYKDISFLELEVLSMNLFKFFLIILFFTQSNFSYALQHEVSEDQLNIGLRRIELIHQCHFDIEEKEYVFDFPLYNSETLKFSEEFQRHTISGGYEKSVFILDNKNIALYSQSKADFIALLMRKEIESYQILSCLGLCTQASPHMGTLLFQDGYKIENAIIVESFSHIVKDGKSRIIELKDSKIKNKHGEQLLFLDSKENFNSLEYNINLFTPLLKDLALWWIIGHPTNDESDSLNVILKQESESQVCARLFLFDMYNYAMQKIKNETSVFQGFNEEISDRSIEAYIRTFYFGLIRSLSEAEIFNTFSTNDMNMVSTLIGNKMKELMPNFKEIFTAELLRLKDLV